MQCEKTGHVSFACAAIVVVVVVGMLRPTPATSGMPGVACCRHGGIYVTLAQAIWGIHPWGRFHLWVVREAMKGAVRTLRD